MNCRNLLAGATELDGQSSWAVQNSWIFPLALAIFLLLISPLITKWTIGVLDGQIATDGARHGVPANAVIYPHVHPNRIHDYVEWATDLVQIVPAGLLPIASTILALTTKISSLTCVLLVLGLAITTIILLLYVSSKDASVYVSGWKLCTFYSVATSFAIAMNVLCIPIILYFGH